MLRTLVLLFLALPLAACQTISHGTTQMVEIRSEPSGATVDISGFGTRTTPAFVMLSRSQSYTVRITKEGYKPLTTNIMAQLSAQRATPDIGVMSVLGSAVDAATGGSWELCPDKLAVNLETNTPIAPLAAAPTAGTPAVAPAPKVNASTPAAPIAQSTPAAPPAAATASTVLAEQLARLDRLLAQGLITQQEYDLLAAAANSAAALVGASPSP